MSECKCGHPRTTHMVLDDKACHIMGCACQSFTAPSPESKRPEKKMRPMSNHPSALTLNYYDASEAEDYYAHLETRLKEVERREAELVKALEEVVNQVFVIECECFAEPQEGPKGWVNVIREIDDRCRAIRKRIEEKTGMKTPTDGKWHTKALADKQEG